MEFTQRQGRDDPSRRDLERWKYAAAGSLISLLCCGVFAAVWLHERERALLSPTGAAESRMTEAPPLPSASPPHEYLGVVLNGSSVDIASKLEGRLQSICCQVGDKVGRGQVVAALEAKAVEHELRIAE